MLDPTTRFLFNSYPRELGKKRNLIRDEEEFVTKIDMMNGADEVFTNVNPMDGSINKIFIDFDGKFALEESQKVYQYLISKNIPAIPIASGKKGVHIYAIFRSRKGEDNKEVLYKATKSIFIGALGDTNKSVDPHVVGDLRRLCRVPNTLRPPENASYCTYLPPGKGFLEMRDKDLWWYLRGTHDYDFEHEIDRSGKPEFKDVMLPEIEKQKVTFTNPCPNEEVKPYVDNEHLKQLLRPCLYRLMTIEEPRHLVRVASTGELLKADFKPKEILAMYRTLKWRDFDEGYTLYQIEHCKPISCSKSKLKQMGACFNCGRSCF
jgi:hypothetical protein